MERTPEFEMTDNPQEADLDSDPFHPSDPSHKNNASSSRYLLSSNDRARSSSLLKNDHGSTTSKESTRLEHRTLVERFGWIGITILVAGTVVILAAVGFLGFIWFADYSNKTWQLIIVRGWATRSVSLSALAIRSAISFQSGLATAMLAALVLERFGVLLKDSARISTLRSSTPHPYNLAYPLVLGWRKNMSKLGIPIIASLLVITTVLLQFTSTVLLADLTLGPIPSLLRVDANRPYNFQMVKKNLGSGINSHYITRPSTWIRKPPNYPVFAEYSEPPFIQDGVKDTGLTLRAFLPLQSEQARESLRNYTGRATVLDARVTCQKPALVNQMVYYSASTITFTGQVYASTKTPRLDNSTIQPGASSNFKDDLINKGTAFGCMAPLATAQTLKLANFTSWQTSICQLEQGGTDGSTVTGGLVSEFVSLRTNKTFDLSDPTGDRWWDRYNVAYLVLNVTSGASNQWEKVMMGVNGSRPPFYSEHDEWVDYIWSKKELILSTTLCYTSFDSADLDVHIHSNMNRSEPTPGYDRNTSSYIFPDIRRQLGQTGPETTLDDRGLLTLEKKSSWRSDFDLNRTERFQSWLQNDGDMGANSTMSILTSGMTGNVTAPLWRDPSLNTYKSSSALSAVKYITPDGMYQALFQEIIGTGGSVAFAIQSLITVFAGLAYYDQLPQFDLSGEAKHISWDYALIPRAHRGFSAVVVVLIIHLITVLCVALWFALESRFTLLGNAWATVSQVVSGETDEAIARSTTVSDERVGAMLHDEARKNQTVGIGRVDDTGRVAIRRRVNNL